MDLITSKFRISVKDTMDKLNIQIIKWDKRFIVSKADNGLISRIYKKFCKTDKGRNHLIKMRKAVTEEESERLMSICRVLKLLEIR